MVGRGRKYKDETAERCDTELIASGDRQTLTRNINIDEVCPRATALSGEPPQEIRERKNEWLKNYMVLSFLFSLFPHVLVCVRTCM